MAGKFAAATGYMAPRRSALETERLQTRLEELPEARITYEQMASHGQPRTWVPFWGDVHAQLTELTEKVLLDDQDEQAALDEGGWRSAIRLPGARALQSRLDPAQQ